MLQTGMIWMEGCSEFMFSKIIIPHGHRSSLIRYHLKSRWTNKNRVWNKQVNLWRLSVYPTCKNSCQCLYLGLKVTSSLARHSPLYGHPLNCKVWFYLVYYFWEYEAELSHNCIFTTYRVTIFQHGLLHLLVPWFRVSTIQTNASIKQCHRTN